jgi:hypothetical protein
MRKKTITMILMVVVAILAFASIGCSQQFDANVEFSWSAPGDDGVTGTASVYDIRYSADSVVVANWDSAVQVLGEPVPSPGGSSEQFAIGMQLQFNTTYFFAIKTADDVPNWSGISNIVRVETGQENIPPATIINFKVIF